MNQENEYNTTLEILLVEDNPDHAELTMHALSTAVKNKVNIVKDGQEALDYLFHQGQYNDPLSAPRPGLILLDLWLPKLNGIEVLVRIKAEESLNAIPICMLTTSADHKDIERCYAAGANSYVSKPVSFKDFIEKVKDIGRFWFSTNILPTLNRAQGKGSNLGRLDT